MKTVIAGTATAIAAVIAASVMGVASAETPASSPTSTSVLQRTVGVEGVATVPLAQGASAATATAAYRQAMAAAEADAHEKAEFLAGKASTTLGAVQSIAEGGGGISCTGEEGKYAEYQGEQPDFGESSVSRSFQAAAGAPSAGRPVVQHPHPHPHRHRHKKTAATKATAASPGASSSAATGCTLSAQVALVYALS